MPEHKEHDMPEHNPDERRFGNAHDAGAQTAREPAVGQPHAEPRIAALQLEATFGDARARLDRVLARGGHASNMLRTMAHAPAVLAGYQELARALKKSELSVSLREQIALAIAQHNDCEYCLASHERAAAAAGLSDAQITDARAGRSADPADAAALRLALTTARDPHSVSDTQIPELLELGFSEGEIVEILGHVALNEMTNAFNVVTRATIDLPEREAVQSGTR